MEPQIDNVHSCSHMTPSKMDGGSTEIGRSYHITDFNQGLTPKYQPLQIKSQLGLVRGYYWSLLVSIRVGLGDVYMRMGMGGGATWQPTKQGDTLFWSCSSIYFTMEVME